MDQTTVILIIAILCGFFMAWGIGANDVANAMGTSVGSKAITLKQAIIIAAIFESAGALLAGGEVTNTIKSNIIDSSYLVDSSSEVIIFGMLSALLAAGTWLALASHFGWPVSTTHSIVGAIIGFGLIHLGYNAINWDKVIGIGASWIFTPILAGIFAYLIFRSIQKLILVKNDPVQAAKKYLPIYVFFVALMISLVTFTKGLKHLGLNLNAFEIILCSVIVGTICMLLGYLLIARLKLDKIKKRRDKYRNLEKVFAILMIFTACAMAFAHGSNDVANAIGPLAAIIQALNSSGEVLSQVSIPIWVLALGAFGIVSGLATYGYKVIATIGEKITELTPSRGFAAELATATTVVLASGTGMPISTTQTLVGAILGVGMARGIGAIRLNVVRTIFTSWVVTLPMGAILAAIFYVLFNLIFM